MNSKIRRAILALFNELGAIAGDPVSRANLLEIAAWWLIENDTLDEGLEDLLEAQFIEANDEKRGPYYLTEEGHRISVDISEAKPK